MTLRLQLFGSFALRDQHDAPCELPVKKARALLAWLALHPDEAHMRGRLSSLLWVDSTESAARHSLRQTLATLRPVVGDGVLVTRRDSVALDAGRLSVDVNEFEELIGEHTLRAAERACELYRGHLLEGFAPRALPFEEWLGAERARLHQLALETMDQLLERYLESGDIALALPLASRLLAVDPLRESAHRALMDLHARRGRHAEALQQYRHCTAVLDRQLGVEPQPATQQLYNEIAAMRSFANEPPPATALTDVRTPVPQVSPASEAMRAEVRHVVVLDIELADFLRMQDTAPETAHTLLAQFYAVVDESLARFGGHVLSRTGEIVCIVFGLPQAHTNDAERAIHCAFAMHESVRKLQRQGLRARVSVAVAAGKVVASRLDGASGFTVTGQPISECAALLARGRAGRTLVTSTARDELPDRFSVRRVGGTPPCWEVDSTPGSALTPTAFVGRVNERNRFASVISDCARMRRGQVILLRGEAGLGKTRLLNEWRAAAAASDYDYLLARAMDFGAAIGHDTVSMLVRRLLSLPTDADRSARREALRKARSENVIAPSDEIFLYDLLDLPMSVQLAARYKGMEHDAREQGRRRTVVRLLEAQANRRQTLVAIEDIHWADAATLQLISNMALASRELPAVIVLTSRAGDEPADPAWHTALRSIACTVFDLPPLQPPEARELADSLVATAPADVDRLLERAGGNPLFLEQLLENAVHGSGQIPDSLQSIASARLDRLQHRDRSAIQAASTLGERFSLEVLQHLIENPEYDPGALVAERLVSASGSQFRFGHVLLRDGIYASLLLSQRRALHKRAAGWYALRDSLLHAEQLERAGDPAAGAAYLRAAQEQADSFHYEQALQLIECARRLNDDPVLAGEIEAQRGSYFQAIGRSAESIEAYETALELATTPAARCRALLGTAAGLRLVNDHQRALGLLTEAQNLAEQLEDDELQARIHHLRGNLLFPFSEQEPCRQAHARALTHARRARSPELETLARGGLGDSEYRAGRHRVAHVHYDRCVALCRQHGLDHLIASVLAMRGHTLYAAMRADDAREDFEAAEEAAALVGNRRDRWCATMGSGNLALRRGDWIESERYFETSLALARELGAQHLEALAAGHRAWLIAETGERAAAEPVLEDALELCRQSGSLEFAGAWLMGALAWVTNDALRRRSALADGEALLDGQSLAMNVLPFCYFAIEGSVELGDYDGAARYLARLEASLSTERVAIADLIVRRTHLLIRHGRGERSAALLAEARELREQERAGGIEVPDPLLEAVVRDERVVDTASSGD